jgi:hypothetical protein
MGVMPEKLCHFIICYHISGLKPVIVENLQAGSNLVLDCYWLIINKMIVIWQRIEKEEKYFSQ